MRPIQTQADIDELLYASRALAVLTAWNERGLFRALAEGPKVLGALGADRRALEIMVPVLQHLGLVYRNGEMVTLSGTGRRLHEAGQLPTARNLEFMGDHVRVPEVLERGGPIRAENDGTKVTDGGIREGEREANERFLDMLYARSAEDAEQCWMKLSPSLGERSRMLDLGGGHGRYARRFADGGCHATLFDFPHIVDYACRRHGNALQYIGGNFRDPDVDFGGPYDLVFVSNIVHGESDINNADLIRRLAATLKPGGSVVLKDMFLDEYGQDPENAVFFGLTMLFYTRGGQSYTISQARRWLEDAGLINPQLTVCSGYQLLRAERFVRKV